MNSNKQKLQGFALAFLAALLWSGNYIVARGIYKEIGPVTLAFFRWLTAILFLLPFVFHSLKQQWPLVKKHIWFLILVGLIGISTFNTILYVAGHYTTAMNLALIATTGVPLFVIFLSALFLKEKISSFQIIGSLICVAGILLLMSKGSLERLAHLRLSNGDLIVLLAALLFAIYTLMVRKKPIQMSSSVFLASTFLLGTLFLMPAWLIERSSGQTFTWSPHIAGIFIYLGLGTSVAAFLCWNIAIEKIGPVRTSLFGNLIPVFSTIEAVIILKEDFNHIILLSIIIIFFGLLLANWGKLSAGKKSSWLVRRG